MELPFSDTRRSTKLRNWVPSLHSVGTRICRIMKCWSSRRGPVTWSRDGVLGRQITHPAWTASSRTSGKSALIARYIRFLVRSSSYLDDAILCNAFFEHTLKDALHTSIDDHLKEHWVVWVTFETSCSFYNNYHLLNIFSSQKLAQTKQNAFIHTRTGGRTFLSKRQNERRSSL